METEDAPLVDAHVHLFGTGDSDPGVWMSPRYRRSLKCMYIGLRLGLARRRHDGDRAYVDRLLEFTGPASLDYLVVLAHDGLYDQKGELDRSRTEVYVSNDYVFRICAGHEKLLPAAAVNPERRDWSEQLDECAERGARYVKVHPCITGLDVSDRRWLSFYRKLRDLGLPLMAHTGPERAARCLGHELGDPARLELPLSEGLTVIAAHAGTSTFFDRLPHFENMVRLMEKYEHLYADTSAVAQAFRWHWMKRLGGHPLVRGRLLHGSDYPIGSTALPWGALSWSDWRRVRGEKNPFTLDYLIKEAAGFGRESARRAARVLGVEAPGPAC